MQHCSFDIVCVGDEAPSSSYTIVRASGGMVLAENCPNNIHRNRNDPEQRVCLSNRKKTAVKNVPAADQGDEEHASAHPFLKANRGEGIHSNDRGPKFPSGRAVSGVRPKAAHHTALATSPKVRRAACTLQAVSIFTPPSCNHRNWIITPKACVRSDKRRQQMKRLRRC